MKIHGKDFRTIWVEEQAVRVIDQRSLPFQVSIETIASADEMVRAISEMHVRGAPLIGVAAAYGAYLAARETASKYETSSRESLELFQQKIEALAHSRPTAVNLRFALEAQSKLVEEGINWEQIFGQMRTRADALAEEDVKMCEQIGEFGSKIISEIAGVKGGGPVNVLTHCNAGWLATVDWGTAMAPVYKAHRLGIPLHVWVSETRPRLQGGKLTAFELAEEGIPHTIVVDNACGHLLQHGKVDLCIVGSDRTTRSGDTANQIGTYLKALACRENGVPFYVALPSSSIDWTISDGLKDIPIEKRDAREVFFVDGLIEGREEESATVFITPKGSEAADYRFDVTPARLITGFITERGVCQASEADLLSLFTTTK